MPLPMSEAARGALASAARDRSELANRLTAVLTIDDIDYTRVVKDLRYYADESAPAVLLEATLGVRLPTEGPGAVGRKDLAITYLIAGDEGVEETEGFLGTVVEVIAHLRTTTITAATGGFAVGRSLGRELDYVNAPPSLVLFDALSDLPYAGIEIEPGLTEGEAGETPLITAYGPDAFRPLDKRADLLRVVREEARLVAADTQLGVASAYSEASVVGDGSSASAVWEVEEGRDCDFDAVGVEAAESERYAAVVVYTEQKDGSQAEVARAEIDNHGVPVDPEDTLDLLFSYEDAEDPDAADSAFDLAFREALKRSVAPVKLTVPLVYWPFHLVRGDLVAVKTREFAEEGGVSFAGEWVRDYLMRVDSFDFGPSRKAATLSGAGELIEKRFVAGEATGEDVATHADSSGASLLHGHDYRGRLRFSEALPWVALITDEQEQTLVRLDVLKAADNGVEIVKENDYVKVSR